MTHPVTSDKLSTLLDAKERKVDARPPAADAGDASVQRPNGRPDSADLGRASERMAQQSGVATESRIGSADQARQLVATLQLDIARDPSAVVSAFGHLNQDGFAAAIAEPA